MVAAEAAAVAVWGAEAMIVAEAEAMVMVTCSTDSYLPISRQWIAAAQVRMGETYPGYFRLIYLLHQY